MSKKKIYSKLFKFSDIKTWKSGKNDSKKILYSEFYDDYKLSFEQKTFFWFANVYKRTSSYTKTYSNYTTFKCAIVPKLSHKIWLFIIPTIFLLIGYFTVESQSIENVFSLFKLIKIISYLFIVFFVIYPLPFIIVNWSLYKIFIKSKYSGNRYDMIKLKEEEKDLDDKITEIINKSLDPNLVRKNKLNNLKKKKYIFF